MGRGEAQIESVIRAGLDFLPEDEIAKRETKRDGKKTIVVLKSASTGEPLHFPADGDPLHTRCGLDAEGLISEERPAEWAGIWCSSCLRA